MPARQRFEAVIPPPHAVELAEVQSATTEARDDELEFDIDIEFDSESSANEMHGAR
jgi:hypothetical protein